MDGPYADECLKVYEETKQYQVSLHGLRNQVDAVYILQPKIPSLYNAFLACLGFVLWNQPARCIATLQSNITALPITSRINLSLEAEIIATVPTCGSSLRSSHGIVWVACLGRESIWLDISVVLVQCSEFYFGFSFRLGKDYNFNCFSFNY